jgi:glyoxylase I family protein
MHTTGVHHLGLTIADVARSRAFYEDVLGFTTHPCDRGFTFAAGTVRISLVVSPHPIPGDQFSASRIGLDHLAFTAPHPDALADLATKLTRAGIDTTGMEQDTNTGNWLVAFHDPDHIPIEYWLPLDWATKGS